MASEENIIEENRMKAWDDMINAQTALYKASVKTNTLQQAHISKLEEEVEAWKAAYDAKKSEADTLKQTVEALKQQLATLQLKEQRRSSELATAGNHTNELKERISVLADELHTIKEENALVVCLIDGDGAIFNELYLRRGRQGGQEAAAKIKSDIRSHLRRHKPLRIASSSTIICTIFFNRMGLCKTLLDNGFCDGQQFLDFFMGFNQADPHFTLMDVGDGKEAADSKLREALKLYAHLPQTQAILFGGAHDNGYAHTLVHLSTSLGRGFLDKLVVLKTYDDMAGGIAGFLSDRPDVGVLEIPGLFMKTKILPPGYGGSRSQSWSGGRPATPDFPRPGSFVGSSPSKSPRKNRKGKEREIPFALSNDVSGSSYNSSSTPPSASYDCTSGAFWSPPTSTSTPATTPGDLALTPRRLDPNKPLVKQTPPPCNNFYLSPHKCRFDSANCKFAHDYDLTPSQVERFRRELKSLPCAILLSRSCNRCSAGPERCFYSHVCPQGSDCSKAEVGRCGFEHPDNTHPPTSPDPASVDLQSPRFGVWPVPNV